MHSCQNLMNRERTITAEIRESASSRKPTTIKHTTTATVQDFCHLKKFIQLQQSNMETFPHTFAKIVMLPLSLYWCHFWQTAVCMGSRSWPHLLPAAVQSIAWLESSSCKGLLTVASSIDEGGPISLVIIAAIQPGSGGMTWLRLVIHFISGGTPSKGTSGFSQYLPLSSFNVVVWLPSEEWILLWLSLNINLSVDKPLVAQLQNIW